MSLSNYSEGKICDVIRGNAAWSATTGLGVKLHTANPNEDGTDGASAETTLKSITFGAPTDGVITSTNSQSWTSWTAGSETITYVSIWDGVVGPGTDNCIAISNSFTGVGIANGETLTISTGATTITIT